MSGRRYGPVTQTSPSDSKGWAPVLRMTYLWWTSVAPAESIALAGQYFVADSSMLRRMAASSRRGPSSSWVTSTRVRTWGYSSRCSPWTWIEYRLMRCRFLVAIEMTSMALHAASATVTASIGLISAAPAPALLPDRRSLELLVVEPRVQAIRGEQLRVRTALHDPAAVVDEDPVCPEDRGQAVGDGGRGPAASAAWMGRSLTVSRAEVASSRMRMRGFFRTPRAIAIRCFSPPDSL